jgi:hypothetical protein
MISENPQNYNSKEELLSSNELNKFCKEFGLRMELEKPFIELDGFIIKVIDSNGDVIKEANVENIKDYEKVSGIILNKLSQLYPR